jgi:glycosyltransferase involved in cell wall biosynthesis
MKIVVAAAAFSSEMSGVQRHAFNMVQSLLQSAEISAIHLVVAPWQRKLLASVGLETSDRLKTHLAPMERSSISRNLWYYRELPSLAAREQADLVHLSYPVPVNASAFSCPTVVTLHDLYPYEIPLNFGLRQIFFHRMILQQCLRGVDAIACVSQITSHRLRQYAPSSTWRKAVQIYNCVEAPQLCAVQAPIPSWQDEPFLLCVAQHRRNKNIPLLLRTFARLLHRREIDLETKLAVIGIAGPETRRIHRLVSRLGLGEKVYLLDGLTEEELQWCYARCKALVLPSMTEGFGLPVAEALLAGCRVVCSDIPAFREIGEGHCRFVDLRNDAEESLAAAIVVTLREPPKPPIALPQLSVQTLAGQYVSLYRELIASASSMPNARYSRAMNVAATERRS